LSARACAPGGVLIGVDLRQGAVSRLFADGDAGRAARRGAARRGGGHHPGVASAARPIRVRPRPAVRLDRHPRPRRLRPGRRPHCAPRRDPCQDGWLGRGSVGRLGRRLGPGGGRRPRQPSHV